MWPSQIMNRIGACSSATIAVHLFLFLAVFLISAQAQTLPRKLSAAVGPLQENAPTQNQAENEASQHTENLAAEKSLPDRFLGRKHITKPIGTKKAGNVTFSPEQHKNVMQELEVGLRSIETIIKKVAADTRNKLNTAQHPHSRVRKSIRRYRALETIPVNEPTTMVHQNHTTFCDETTGPCLPGANTTDEEDVDFLKSVSENRSDIEQLNYDKESIIKLLGELKFYLKKREELTSDEKDDASLDVDKIGYLVRDISILVETRISDLEKVKVSSGLSLSSQILSTSVSPELLEQQIADNMKVNTNNLDVSVMGNSAKEMGNQMGKIPSNVAQSHNMVTTTASESRSGSISEDNVYISTTERLPPPNAGENIQPQSPENSAQSINAESNYTEAMSTSVNQSSQVPLNPLDMDIEKIDLSSLLFQDETKYIERVNEEHEKHKEAMLKLIRKVKLTGVTEEDAKRVREMEEQVEAIEREHQRMMNINLLYRDNFPNNQQHWGPRPHGPRRHHHRNNHHFQHQQQPRPIEKLDGNPRVLQNPGGQQFPSNTVEGDWRIQIKAGQPPPPRIMNGVGSNIAPPLPPPRPKPINPEVNFNGGFEESVDELKLKYPQGYWPKEVDSMVGSASVARKVQKLVDEHPELKPRPLRPLPINIVFRDDYEYDESEDGETGQAGLENNHVGITKRDLLKNSLNYELSPENLEEIIIKERQRNTANNAPKRNHHIQEHDAKAKLLKRSLEMHQNLRKRLRK